MFSGSPADLPNAARHLVHIAQRMLETTRDRSDENLEAVYAALVVDMDLSDKYLTPTVNEGSASELRDAAIQLLWDMMNLTNSVHARFGGALQEREPWPHEASAETQLVSAPGKVAFGREVLERQIERVTSLLG